MEFSISSSNYCDTEDSFSEDSLNTPLSEGHVPHEDTVSCDDTTFEEEITFNVDFSVQWLLTHECRGGVQSESSPISRRGSIQDSWEPGFMQSSALSWDDHGAVLAEEDRVVHSLLNNLHNYLQTLNDEGNQADDNENQADGNEEKKDDKENEQIPGNDKADGSVFPGLSVEHDFQLGGSCSLHMAQVRHREHDTYQDLPECKALKNKDIQFPEMTPMLKRQNLKKVVNQMVGHRMVSSPETGWTSAVQPDKDTSSSTRTTRCVSFRRPFRWMRKQLTVPPLDQLKDERENVKIDSHFLRVFICSHMCPSR
ncbi:uncharacterized protein C12orf71 homolog [Octodon degus]|uniref:Uncharacterized protein C12orf71 homolog n=1 Tax=Octodon degus TaxID=10160 RepID=A0A6P3EX53_OCTDE|nr:uncharacterized protein C12orf71 homolog [Octodon degus]